ncbi:hypothetical protein [Halopelagius longus]|uniref:DUF2892 domain-containing protein n=1 Tax=Halopelagius longus TaxID=1236180 RepID=A0A1H1DQJ1_9EURY|nr:hypothetical protein [Halopelagius longus]RDI71430.1 DUF2892 domain-containing protein [Halopelagius longus]SDQ78801.1 hypothetical protein SAMN05216278_2535 [Halopelagius longus]
MDLRETIEDREPLVRVLLAAGLAAVAISSLRRGRRLSGLLAGGGALALGYTMTAEPEELEELTEAVGVDASEELGGLTETVGLGTADGDSKLDCAVCGEPIAAGEARGPNEDNEIVHRTCR